MPTPVRSNAQTVHYKRDWRVWWRLLRPHTLTAAFVPVSIGTVLAVDEAPIHFPLFFAMLVASLFIQAATNMFNEYYDYKRGLDTPESVGIGGAIVRDGISQNCVIACLVFFCSRYATWCLYLRQ
ncbi:1,4-dihydroxy-2-naphthoate octaprenyltransferase [Anoxybacillus sp. BCO1]|nr:1,4-dihydroxy-2-naphthoate octaprenyltransferase [Anoxybacillus sp. BCO1]